MEEPHFLFDWIVDSAVLLDKSGRIVDWNTGATTLFGYPKKEVVGRSLNLIYQQNYPFSQIIQETLTQHKKWTAETHFIRKNGMEGVCKTTAVLINQATVKPLALITHQNISHHKQTELELTQDLHNWIEQASLQNALLLKAVTTCDYLQKELRESELRFHLLAENATDMISRHTLDGKYLYVSPSAKLLLGYGPEELLNQSTYKFIHHDDIGKLKKILNRRKESVYSHPVIYRIRHKNGDYRWIESNVRFISDEQHTIREVQLASRDITDRILDKKARLRGQQLAHVFRLNTMEEMASGMAHEIGQPLAAVVNYTQGCVRYLEKEHHDPNQLIEIMKKAVAQAERAGEVIHRLKNFFCKGQLIKTPCKINSLIREAVSLIRNDLNNTKTKIEFDLAKDAQLVFADKIQVQQVMLNLIQNAIEAMKGIDPQHRKIYIQSKISDSKSIEITVRDSGPGFSKEMIHKAFEPFFTTKAHGRGMGLAICRSIIEAHGGQFSINSNVNHNSWIRFVLPITGE